ncbi:MAG: bis(5'-nucleosyl)-tetraphosphatase (symmetrical) YqeK [Lachnospiraceae bacterium]|nr:bis(5'-nucleosyl)-tetraphosphatase (symmetrical) YqeK [Lachnospiraceae bacterium]
MLSINSMDGKLMSALSIKRYIHTKGVVKEAIKLAKLYGDETLVQKAEIAALLHDCAKDYPDDMKLRIAKEYHIKIDDIFKEQPDLLHPFLGAEIAKREYEVTDVEILDAIRYHTTGRCSMSLLEKIIFTADYIEESRKPFEGLDKARELAYKNIDEAVLFILEETIEYVKNQGREVFFLSASARNYYRDILKK